MSYKKFQEKIWEFYCEHGRHDLPWRRFITPYKVAVSEIMLQQTQVDRVIPFYKKWMRDFPSWKKLAEASQVDVLRHWKGLGYNSRALRLQKLAKILISQHRGKVPHSREELEKLPGIGPYTAGAVRAFAFDEPDVFIETNIRRVYLHHFFKGEEDVSDKEILEKVQRSLPPLLRGGGLSGTKWSRRSEGYNKRHTQLTPRQARGAPLEGERKSGSVRDWYYALMDYGSYLTKTIPNPNRKSKHYAKQSKFEGSDRQLRGKILEVLLKKGKINSPTLMKVIGEDIDRVTKVVAQLEAEGFLKTTPHTIRLI